MSLEKYYGVLGLRPDASEQDVKNAYRDLAKVWHPDRFARDPRLQQKAQEKLKEVNEAYEEINSSASGRRRARRSAPPPPPSSSNSAPRPPRGPGDFTHADFSTVVARRGDTRGGASRLTPVACAAVAVVITFFVSYRFLSTNKPAPAGVRPQAAAQGAEEQPAAEELSDAGERREKKATGKQTRAGESTGAADGGAGAASTGARGSAPDYKPLPTVNRTIDPTTGLLATRACPLKALRTFASGQEPQKFCDADHSRRSASVPAPAPAPTQAAAQSPAPSETKSKSRLKSVLGAVASPGKWFRKTEAPRGETKTGAGQE